MTLIRFYWLSMLTLMLAAFLAQPERVMAETHVTLGGIGAHIPNEPHYNNWHQMISVSHNGYALTRFINSYNRETVALTKEWSWPLTQSIDAGLLAGGMYGYTHCPIFEASKKTSQGSGKLCPLAAPAIMFNTQGNWQPTFILMGNSVSFSVRLNL